jgi:hypothetical protein
MTWTVVDDANDHKSSLARDLFLQHLQEAQTFLARAALDTAKEERSP